MNTPSQQSKLLLSWRFPSEEALDEADITVPIAGERHIHFHDQAVGRCCNETRQSCTLWAPMFSHDATSHLVHRAVLWVRCLSFLILLSGPHRWDFRSQYPI